MNILCNTLLPNEKVQAIPATIGKVFKPIPVNDRILEIDVAPKIPIVSIGFKFLFRVL